ncbi:c-type cytochrome [Marinimicrobium sp. C2-29]|uniref:c-type cytochrome n=1 Tax=Marinimicrobium sp. C2-29 TaxID=3139825 RepID=UPI0031398939
MIRLLILLSAFAVVSACSQGPESPRGFSLPEGDVEQGKAVFNDYECLACHTLKGYQDTDVEKELDTPVKLGGEVVKVKTYAELLTSIINPSHRIAPGYEEEVVTDERGESRMRNYNDVMTVSELIDLVAFLETHYVLNPYPRTEYHMYYP